MATPAILVDTNVIIACHEAGCWKQLAAACRLETVEKCLEETQTGKQKREIEQHIDEPSLRASLHAVHPVSTVELAGTVIYGGGRLDDGERHLWAHALRRTDPWQLCGPDRASMRFGHGAGHKDDVRSLETLFKRNNLKMPSRLPIQYRRVWHEEEMLNLTLGILA